MTELKDIISPTKLEIVVAFSDLTGFARFSNNLKRKIYSGSCPSTMNLPGRS